MSKAAFDRKFTNPLLKKLDAEARKAVSRQRGQLLILADTQDLQDVIEASTGATPKKAHLAKALKEAHRVLKPGGTFYAITPYYPRDEAFVDPTHVNIITNKTHTYFTSPQHSARMYGFTGSFEINEVKRIKPSQETTHKHFIFRFVKNIYYTIRYKKKSHLLWKFSASKK